MNKKTKISGWGNYPQKECTVTLPETNKDIEESLDSPQLITRGLGRSYADQALNEGNKVLTFTRMDNFLNWDEKTGILECEAGVSLDDIILTYAPRGWFPLITPGTKFVTIGGCIANDIHGKAHHVDGSFYNSVEERKVKLADGSVVTASREEMPEFFKANFGGLGLLGIILSVKLKLKKIETTYFTQKSVTVENIDELLDAFDKYDDKYNYSVAWIDSTAIGENIGKGVLSLGNMAKLNDLPKKLKKDPLKTHTKPKLNLPFNLPGFSLNKLSIKILNLIINRMQAKAKNIAHYESFFFPLDAIDNWNRGYGKKGFIQYQFVIPFENGRENIKKILEVISSSNMLPFLNVLKKFGKGIEGLSFPMEGYTFAIDFPYHKNLKDFTKKLDQMVQDFNGRIYLGKDAMLEKEMFRKMYPQYEEFMEMKKQYDPENKLQSDISKRLGLT